MLHAVSEHSGEVRPTGSGVGSIANLLAGAALDPTNEDTRLRDRTELLESEVEHLKRRNKGDEDRARARELTLKNKAKEAELEQLKAQNEALTLRHEVERLKQEKLQLEQQQLNQQPGGRGGRGGRGNGPPNKLKRQYHPQGGISRAQGQLLLNALAPGNKRQRGGWGGRGGRGGRGSDQQEAPADATQGPAHQ